MKRRTKALASAVVGLAAIAGWALWHEVPRATSSPVEGRRGAGEQLLPTSASGSLPAAGPAHGHPMGRSASVGQTDGTTLVDRFWMLLRDIEARSNDELRREFGAEPPLEFQGSVFTAALRELAWKEYTELAYERVKLVDGDWQALAGELAPEGNDLAGAYVMALDRVSRPILRAWLVDHSGFGRRDPRFAPALTRVLARVAAERDHFTEPELMFPLMTTAALNAVHPGEVFTLVMDSGMELLARDFFIWLHRFPVEQVEEMLWIGLADDRWWVRFGAMEAVRDFGIDGKIDVDRFASRLVAIVEDDPEGSLYFLEAIGALGRADPLLTDLVLRTQDEGVRRSAAHFVVLRLDPDVAMDHVRSWLEQGGPAARVAVSALGDLPGEAASALLRNLFQEAASDEERLLALQAMAGRKDACRTCLRQALRAGDETLRLTAVQALLDESLMGWQDEEDVGDELSLLASTDPSEDVRTLALVAWGLRAGDQAQALLKDRLLGDGSPRVRGAAGVALILASQRDPQLAEWVDDVVTGESNPIVRQVLSDFREQLTSPEKRAEMAARLEQEAFLEQLVSDSISAGGAPRNPAALRAQYLQHILVMLGEP